MHSLNIEVCEMFSCDTLKSGAKFHLELRKAVMVTRPLPSAQNWWPDIFWFSLCVSSVCGEEEI